MVGGAADADGWVADCVSDEGPAMCDGRAAHCTDDGTLATSFELGTGMI